jgi:hypothetical protein
MDFLSNNSQTQDIFVKKKTIIPSKLVFSKNKPNTLGKTTFTTTLAFNKRGIHTQAYIKLNICNKLVSKIDMEVLRDIPRSQLPEYIPIEEKRTY